MRRPAVPAVAVPVVVLVLVLALCAACGADDEPAPRAHADVKICVYTDGNAADFWQTVKGGAEQAGEDLGVTLDYQETEHDTEAESNLVLSGIDAGCDGIAFSASDPAGLQSAADAAHAAGVPLVTLGAGVASFARLHAFTHVGQDDAETGRLAAARMAELGATTVLCVGAEGQDPALDQVCAGAGAADSVLVTKGLADLPLSATEIGQRLESDPGIDGVLVLDPDLAVGSAVRAVRAAGSDAVVGAVGVSGPARAAVDDGSLAFATDEQPYLEGYLPVVLLYLRVTTGEETGGGRPVHTGPVFVTR